MKYKNVEYFFTFSVIIFMYEKCNSYRYKVEDIVIVVFRKNTTHSLK